MPLTIKNFQLKLTLMIEKHQQYLFQHHVCGFSDVVEVIKES